MALPFQNLPGAKRGQIVAIDLGARSTKAIYVQKRGQGYGLSSYVLQDAPIFEKNISPDLLADHLKNVVQALGAKVKQITLVAGVNDSVLRLAELPAIPVSDMRLMLKYNAKNYLQQELPDHVYDCQVLPPRQGSASGSSDGGKKHRVIVGAAKRQYLDLLQAGAKTAGFVIDQIAPNLIGAPNALEMCQPEVFQNEVVALVDIGFKNSTIAVLLNGELALTRVVAIGGDKLTSGLAEALSISYPEAEGLKVGLPEEVQGLMQTLLMPLGRELRASIDFFEHQQDRTVSQVFVSGGSARSQFIIEMLQSELMVPCKAWNPISFLELGLAPQQMGEVEQVAPQLAVAAGAAVAAFA